MHASYLRLRGSCALATRITVTPVVVDGEADVCFALPTSATSILGRTRTTTIVCTTTDNIHIIISQETLHTKNASVPINRITMDSMTRGATRGPNPSFFCLRVSPFYSRPPPMTADRTSIGGSVAAPCPSHRRWLAPQWGVSQLTLSQRAYGVVRLLICVCTSPGRGLSLSLLRADRPAREHRGG